jgi:hypothetical protein
MYTLLSLTLAFIALLATVYGVLYYYLSTRHKERMALIESGLDPAVFTGSSRLGSFLLMLGVVFLGLALAVAAGTLIEIISGYSFSQFPQIYLIVFPFFMGLSLLACYFIARRMGKPRPKP